MTELVLTRIGQQSQAAKTIGNLVVATSTTGDRDLDLLLLRISDLVNAESVVNSQRFLRLATDQRGLNGPIAVFEAKHQEVTLRLLFTPSTLVPIGAIVVLQLARDVVACNGDAVTKCGGKHSVLFTALIG